MAKKVKAHAKHPDAKTTAMVKKIVSAVQKAKKAAKKAVKAAKKSKNKKALAKAKVSLKKAKASCKQVDVLVKKSLVTLRVVTKKIAKTVKAKVHMPKKVTAAFVKK